MSQLASPRYLARLLMRRLPMILLVIVIGFPAALVFALLQPKIYEARATLQIEAPQVTEQLAGSGTMTISNDNQLDLIQQKLTSRDNLMLIIEKYDLFAGLPGPEMRLGMFRDAITIIKLVDPSQAFRMDVMPSGLSIAVRLGDPQVAADVANDLVDSILVEAQSRSEGRASRALSFFVAEEARVGDQMVQLERELATFKEENVDSLPEALASQQTRLTRLVETQLEIDQQLISLQTSSTRLREDDLNRQTNLLQQQRDLISLNIRQIEDALAKAPEVERQLSALDRRLIQLSTEYTLITTRRAEAAMSQLLESQQSTERFEILESAIPPENAVSTSRKKIALAVAFLVIVVAVGGALALETINGTIRTASQLEDQLGIRAVIVVPNLTATRAKTQRPSGRRGGAGIRMSTGLFGGIKGRAQAVSRAIPLDRLSAAFARMTSGLKLVRQ